MTTLLVSTRNRHKLDEIRQILGCEVIGLDTFPNMPEVEETGPTFEENAALKALAASEHFAGYVIADDSGLEVDALDGSPGVYSARFAGKAASDADNNALLLDRLQGVSKRQARFRCVIVLVHSNKPVATFHGTIEGRIAEQPSGTGGFGYDSLFIPEGYKETFASMPQHIKNSMSHRARALTKLKILIG